MLSSMGIAIAIHVLIALAVGSYVVFEGIVPVPYFNSDFVDTTVSSSPIEEMPSLIEEEALPDLASTEVETVQEAGSSEGGPDLSDLLTVTSATISPRFTMPTTVGNPALLAGNLTGGTGSGGDGNGKGVGLRTFLGQQVRGELAVILDTTGSLFTTVFLVTAEIEENFQSAMKIGIRGAAFYDDKAIGEELIPITDSQQWKGFLKSHADRPGTLDKLKRIYDSLAKYDQGYAYEMAPRSEVKVPNSTRRNKEKPITNYQSLGTPIELLVQSKRKPHTIYVFSDFLDGVDPGYMKELQVLVKRSGTKIIFWNPFDRWKSDLKHYQEFAEATGGEIKTGGLEPTKK